MTFPQSIKHLKGRHTWDIYRVMDIKNTIDDIFSTRSIYKSLIVCHDDELTDNLVEQLVNDAYPISQLKNIGNYLKNDTRILVIDYIDYSNLSSFLDDESISKISLVIFIDGKPSTKLMPENCESIFKLSTKVLSFSKTLIVLFYLF